MDDVNEPPLNFFRSIRQFENGRVYEVLLKNNEGEFVSYEQIFQSNDNVKSKKKFLICIVTQELFYNDHYQHIAYIKDVTFGVLYEQIRAQDYLQTMLNNALQHRIGLPLDFMIKSCKKVEDSNELRLIEKHNDLSSLREELQLMKTQSQLIIYSFKDL